MGGAGELDCCPRSVEIFENMQSLALGFMPKRLGTVANGMAERERALIPIKCKFLISLVRNVDHVIRGMRLLRWGREDCTTVFELAVCDASVEAMDRSPKTSWGIGVSQQSLPRKG